MTISTEVASLIGISPSSCRRIAESAYKRYKIFLIPKREPGGFRQVAQPAREVKALQRAIISVIAPKLPVHDAATAYKKGSSILENARRHQGSKFITKLDFSNFFPSINAASISHHLRAHITGIADSDITFILAACLWRREGPHALCIGAPSSPLLSNSVMFELDSVINERADQLQAVYTRYSDDITISSAYPDVLSALEIYIRDRCAESTHPRLTINERKRVAVGRGSGMYVTGLTLANQGGVTVGRDRKRGVRAGVRNFFRRSFTIEELDHLKGELAFVLSIEPEFRWVLQRTYGLAVARLLPRETD